MKHASWSLSLAVNSLCLVTSAWGAGSTGSGAEASAAGSQESADETASLAEVIVTAARRVEDVQKEPRTIDTLSSADLERRGVNDALSFSAADPAVSITKAGPQLQIYIRGVGDKTATAADDPAIALNLGGVYLPRNYEGGDLFYDLQRVEVLKGPQGTLYGRNATGGAINLLPAPPELGNLDAFVELEGGNFADVSATGAVNLPVGSTMALRVSGQVARHSGYLSNGYDDDQHQSGRVQGLWEPSDRTSLTLSADFSHLGGRGGGIVLYPAVAGTSPWTNMTDPQVKSAESPVLQALLQPDLGHQNAQSTIVSATLVQALTDSINLTVLPSYVHGLNNTLMLNGGIPIYTDTLDRQYALETRLSSRGDSRLTWVAGGLIADEHQSEIFEINQLIQLNGWNNPTFDDRSKALFGEATYSVLDNLRVTAGLRWTAEDRTLVGNGFSMPGAPPGTAPLPLPFNIPPYDPAPPPLGFVPPFTPVGSFAYDDQRTFVRSTWRGGIAYDVTPTSMAYATVSTGFKSGGFYVAQGPNSYEPETLTAYELGSKNRFLNNRLELDAEGFYWRYANKQETALGLVPPGVLNTITKNAGAATLYGLDLDVRFALTMNDLLSLNLTAMHSRYDRFVYDQFSAPPLGLPQTACAVHATGSPVYAQVDCSGEPLTRAPQFKGQLGYQHTQPLGSDLGSLIFSSDMVVSSGYFLSTDYLNGSQAYTDAPPLGSGVTRYPNEWTGGYATFDASLTWDAPHHLALTAWARNIGNRAVYTQAVSNTFVLGMVEATIAAPRTYGVRLRYDF